MSVLRHIAARTPLERPPGVEPGDPAWQAETQTVAHKPQPADPTSPASECDTCPKPGACCTNFPLSHSEHLNTPIEAMVWAAGVMYEDPNKERMFIGIPFVPLSRTPDGRWRWRCVDLLPNGRCGNYENRPYGPCVVFTPGQDALCAIHPDHGKKAGALQLPDRPVRHRSRRHLDFVGTLRCMVCGAEPPNDPHHLKYAQLRAKNLKSGDQWTVPLCRPCHQRVELAGDEKAHWDSLGINPLPLAIELWSISASQAAPEPSDANPVRQSKLRSGLRHHPKRRTDHPGAQRL